MKRERIIFSLRGVVLSDGSIVETKSLVIATGTFLGAEIFKGTERIKAGRIGEKVLQIF